MGKVPGNTFSLSKYANPEHLALQGLAQSPCPDALATIVFSPLGN
jgi:hypothetical protein